MRRAAAALLLTSALLIAACDSSKEDILKKAEGIETRQQLEEVLGRPDDISKLGPMESWTYKASNGSVTFVLAGDVVTLQSTKGPEGATR